MTEPKKMNYITEQLRPLAIHVDELEKDNRNCRRHPDKNMKAIIDSLRAFGQRKPVVVQKTSAGKMIIRAGNGTYQGTLKLRREFIAAVVIEEDDDNAMAYAIADNRSGELAEWDQFELGDTLRELVGSGFDINSLGFNDKELDKLIGDVGESVKEAVGKKKLVDDTPEYLIIIEAEDESEQQELFEELQGRGLACKII